MNIDNKIRADLFRNRIEDKNQLTGAGAIYVGTGIPKYIDSAGATTGTPSTGTIGPFYETTSITPTTGGQVPVSVMGTGSAEATGTVAGLTFKSVKDALKDTDGNINLDAKGFNFQANGTTYVESNTCYLTATGSSGSFVSIAANKINLNTYNVTFGDDLNKTTLNNVGEIGFQSGSAVPPYVAPSGTLDKPGGTPYAEDTEIYSLTPIISNISARLDIDKEDIVTVKEDLASVNNSLGAIKWNVAAITSWDEITATSKAGAQTIGESPTIASLDNFDIIYFEAKVENSNDGDVLYIEPLCTLPKKQWVGREEKSIFRGLGTFYGSSQIYAKPYEDEFGLHANKLSVFRDISTGHKVYLRIWGYALVK